jgi:hypothetical protein
MFDLVGFQLKAQCCNKPEAFSDWTLFTAGTANTAVTRKKFIASVRSHASFNQSRGAFANKYDGQTGSQSSGFGR